MEALDKVQHSNPSPNIKTYVRRVTTKSNEKAQKVVRKFTAVHVIKNLVIPIVCR